MFNKNIVHNPISVRHFATYVLELISLVKTHACMRAHTLPCFDINGFSHKYMNILKPHKRCLIHNVGHLESWSLEKIRRVQLLNNENQNSNNQIRMDTTKLVLPISN